MGLEASPLAQVKGAFEVVGDQLDRLAADQRGPAFWWVIVPAVVALVVWIGVISAGFGDEPAPATAG